MNVKSFMWSDPYLYAVRVYFKRVHGISYNISIKNAEQKV